MNTSTRDMLSPDLAWRQLDLEYERNFPQYTNNLLVVVEAVTPDQAQDAADLLYKQLLNETKLFETVYYPNALPIFKESSLLFLDVDELQDLSDNLAKIQPFLSKLTEDQSIRGLFAMLSKALDAIADGDNIDIKPLLVQINQTISTALEQRTHRVSWHKLMSGNDDSDPQYRAFIILQPVLDYSKLFPAEPAIERLQALSTELNFEEDIGARLRLTGGSALSYEELQSVTRGTKIAVVLAFSMVAMIMLFGLGSLRLTLATLVTLFCGLILTAAFLTF